jgi:acylphosphatase
LRSSWLTTSCFTGHNAGEMSETRKRRLRLRGRVQGVFYRAWAVENANALGLRGWVRNRRDGSVELLVSGNRADVERFIERCYDGPAAARVDQIEVEQARDEVPERFEKRPTA